MLIGIVVHGSTRRHITGEESESNCYCRRIATLLATLQNQHGYLTSGMAQSNSVGSKLKRSAHRIAGWRSVEQIIADDFDAEMNGSAAYPGCLHLPTRLRHGLDAR